MKEKNKMIMTLRESISTLICLACIPFSIALIVWSDIEFIDSCVSVYNSYWRVGNLYLLLLGWTGVILSLRWFYNINNKKEKIK